MRLPLRHQVHATTLLALSLLLGACGGPPTRPEPHANGRNWPDAPGAERASRLSLEQANDVTLHAIQLVGTPYRYGGNTPESGFDCSGLIGFVYRTSAGVQAPRTVAALIDWGQPVAAQNLRSGDLVVFVQNGVAGHAGIYVGEGRFVHAPSRGGEVRLDTLDSKYWSRQLVFYRRP